MKIGLVTCKAYPNLTPNENLLIPLYANHGIIAEPLIWNDPSIRWQDFAFLIFRSAWDSHIDPNAFSQWLDHLSALGIKTLNPIDLVKQNQHKFYLRDLQDKNISTIPTLFVNRTDHLDLAKIQDTGWDKAVVKPAISANSFFTELFNTVDYEPIQDMYARIAKERDLILQEFMPEIQTTGELSLIFLNRKFSHAVLKTAHEKDFRVQESYGGKAITIQPEKRQIQCAENILSQFEGDILYARVDGVIRNHQFYLMEIEPTEPELYLDYSPNARQRFVNATLDLSRL